MRAWIAGMAAELGLAAGFIAIAFAIAAVAILLR